MARRDAVAAAALCGLLLTACATAPQDAAGPSVASSVASPGASATVAIGEEALLPAGDMPEWNGAVVWTVEPVSTGGALQLCPPPPMTQLGATAVAQRDYAWLEGGMRGWNAVARFDSPAAASNALAAIAERFDACPGASRISDVDTGATWTLSEPLGGDSDEARFEFMGAVGVDSTLAVVGFSLTGQDANWERDPLADSLRASAARVAALP